MKNSDRSGEGIIGEIIDAAKTIHPMGQEPGVELVNGLADLIYKIMQNNNDSRIAAKKIMLGSFQTTHAVALEAHKTIDLLVEFIIKATAQTKGDVEGATKGLIEGIAESAKKVNLNVEEAVDIAATNAVKIAYEINDQIGERVKLSATGTISGVKVKLITSFPKDRRKI